MKKLILLLTIALLNISVVLAQKINYESSFEKAVQKAKAEGKPLAILLTIEMPGSTTIKTDGLKDKTVIDKFNNEFINFKAEREDTASSRQIIKKYKIHRFPSFIFLDAKAGFMFTDVARMATPVSLHEILDKALSASTQTSIVYYDSIYNAGNRSASLLKEYILRRQATGVSNNANLIEEYVNSMAVADLNKYEEVLFILKAGPYADSIAHRLTLINKSISDSIYKNEPLSVRVAINNAIINNTMSNAIAHKNFNRANAAANFARTSWVKNYQEGNKAWLGRMLQYYMGVKDTTLYLSNAIRYYDQYYMQPGIEYSRKKDSLKFLRAKANGKVTEVYDSSTQKLKRTTTFSVPKGNADAVVLNNVAWLFYGLTSQEEPLIKAMLWSRRSIELEPKAAYYDTYAHLLYKLSMFKEAEENERMAIAKAKEEKINSGPFDISLKKIISRNL